MFCGSNLYILIMIVPGFESKNRLLEQAHKTILEAASLTIIAVDGNSSCICSMVQIIYILFMIGPGFESKVHYMEQAHKTILEAASPTFNAVEGSISTFSMVQILYILFLIVTNNFSLISEILPKIQMVINQSIYIRF